MRDAFNLFQHYDMVRGNFIPMQLVTDLNYSEVINFDEMEFIVAGPGACSGIYKCLGPRAVGQEVAIIRWVAEHQDEEFARRGLRFAKLWGAAAATDRRSEFVLRTQQVRAAGAPGDRGHRRQHRDEAKI